MSIPPKSSLEDITIPNGTDSSRVVRSVEEYFDALALEVDGPAALDALTFVFETADNDAFSTNVRTIQVNDPPTDLSAPGALKTRVYGPELLGVKRFRIKASGNVAADRTWKATKTWR